jgi:hypothetical protein
MNVFTQYSASEVMWAGFIPFCICSFWGLRFVIRSFRGDTLDSSGSVAASRGWSLIGGLLAQLPLVAYTYFVWKQGLFGS